MIQKPFSNKVVLLDNMLREVKSIETEEEQSDGRIATDLAKLEFKSFNNSKDRCFGLYRAGGSSLYVIDLLNMKLEEKIQNFWLVNGKPSNPIGASGSLDAEIIVGLSSASQEAYMFHYFHRGMAGETKTVVYPIETIVPKSSALLPK